MEFRIFLFMSVGFLRMVKEQLYTEGILIYYLTQSGLSMTLLVLIVWSFSKGLLLLCPTVLLVLIGKLGVFPLNFWFYSAMIKTNTLVLFFMMTLQKLPILIFFQFSEIKIDLFYLFVLLNLAVRGAIALLSSDLKTLLVSSSLANNS